MGLESRGRFLVEAGHEAIAVDLPGDDETAGLARYTELVVDAIGSRSEVVVVAGSLGGFTAPLVCERVPVRELVLVNAMIPDPGETARDWWAHTGAPEAQEEAARAGGYGPFDVATYFLHDVDAEVAAEGEPYQRSEADIAFDSVCDFTAWPASPFVSSPALTTASSRSACSAGSLATASASRLTCFRVGTCCHSCNRGSWLTICCRRPAATDCVSSPRRGVHDGGAPHPLETELSGVWPRELAAVDTGRRLDDIGLVRHSGPRGGGRHGHVDLRPHRHDQG